MLDVKLKEAIYKAITESSGDLKAIEQAIEEIHTQVCIEILYAVFQDPIIAEMPKDEVVAEINPVLQQIADDFNETLEPYKIVLPAWDALALAKRVEYLESGGIN